MAVKLGGEARPRVRKAKVKAAKPRKKPKATTTNKPVAARPERVERKTPAGPSVGRSYSNYFSLVRKFPLEPIRDDPHLDQALDVVERLLKRELDEQSESYLEVLTGLIEAYEGRAFPIPEASEAEVLRELMRANGLSQTALAARVGIAQPTISAILSGARELTKDQVLALARYFHVSPAAFLRLK